MIITDIEYQLICKKSVIRKVNILNSLSIQKQSASELKKTNVISQATLTKDISEINSLGTEGDYPLIKEQPKNFFELNTSNMNKLNMSLKKLLSDNPLYVIIDDLFHNKSFRIEEYSQRLFMSQSSIRSALYILKEYLKTFHIHLNLSPLQLIGSEVNVRIFFFHYVQNISGIKDTYFSSKIDKFIVKSKKDLHSPLHLDYQRLKNWLYVFFKRILAQKMVSLNNSLKRQIMGIDSYIFFKKIVHKNSNSFFNILIDNEDELIFSYIVRLDIIIYENKRFYFISNFQDRLSKHTVVVSKFFSMNNLTLSEHSDLMFSLQALFCNLDLLTEISPLFQKVDNSLKKQIKVIYKELFECWSHLLSKYFSWQYTEDVAVQATLLVYSHLTLYYKKSIEVLFSYTGSPTNAMYYNAITNQVIPSSVNAHFIFDDNITNKVLQDMKIDILVCNFPPREEITCCKVIQLPSIISDKTWGWLASIGFYS
ncbi:hypothetical protein IGJ74_000844 [Enterococcus sp. AZ009]|uniref:helix-turn-helix domain-containing protein n=1 Tax=Enterococcus TaxID=1350 RepID=UPI003B59E8C4